MVDGGRFSSRWGGNLQSSLAILVLTAFGSALVPHRPTRAQEISYSRDIKPIFQRHCWSCHQGAKASGDYIMSDPVGLMTKGDSDEKPIVPGHPGRSHLVELITPTDGHAAMPADSPPLAPQDIEKIAQWILEGAVIDEHQRHAPFDGDHRPIYHRAPIITRHCAAIRRPFAQNRNGAILAGRHTVGGLWWCPGGIWRNSDLECGVGRTRIIATRFA